MIPPMTQRRSQDDRMGRADRGNTKGTTLSPERGQLIERNLHQERLSVEAMNASSS